MGQGPRDGTWAGRFGTELSAASLLSHGHGTCPSPAPGQGGPAAPSTPRRDTEPPPATSALGTGGESWSPSAPCRDPSLVWGRRGVLEHGAGWGPAASGTWGCVSDTAF